MKNSIIMICKGIKIDKNYQNVLTYTEQQMYTLCYQNRVAIDNKVSFIKGEDKSILVNFTYEDCLKCNYMAFQNPRYSNKWFFAFIDSVEYVSDSTTRINFTVDIFSTWYDYWTAKDCFVIREHTNDDTVGANLIDEGLYLGEFKTNAVKELDAFSSFVPVIAVSEIITAKDVSQDPPSFYKQGGIFNGLCYIVGYDSNDMTSNIVRMYDKEGKSDAIKFIFMAPSDMLSLSSTYTYNFTYESGLPIKYKLVDSNVPYEVSFGGSSYAKPTTLDGYTPINKKLLINPYQYLAVDSYDGGSHIFNYEDFEGANYGFAIEGVITPGCSIKITPLSYKGVTTQGANQNYMYSFANTKFPICSWSSDVYTNWLTQNGVNLGFTTLNKSEAVTVAGVGSILLGTLLMASGVGAGFGAGLIGTGATGIFTAMQSDYKAQMIPDEVKGNLNSGDINFALDLVYPKCYQMSIKNEVARSIDDFFTRFGYKTNRLKLPNQTGRTYFNYIQIGTGEIIGYPNSNGCPSEAMEEINNMYRSGITLWHDHSRIGNYSGNTIVQNNT